MILLEIKMIHKDSNIETKFGHKSYLCFYLSFLLLWAELRSSTAKIDILKLEPPVPQSMAMFEDVDL